MQFFNISSMKFYPFFPENALICTYKHIYRVSVKKGRSHGGSMEEIKENKKVLYHFANFAIVNEIKKLH